MLCVTLIFRVEKMTLQENLPKTNVNAQKTQSVEPSLRRAKTMQLQGLPMEYLCHHFTLRLFLKSSQASSRCSLNTDIND